MEMPETHMVTPENGPRPAGKPDQCFYCPRHVGEEHAPDCVCRKRTVVVRATVEAVLEVPESWTTEDIEHLWNDSHTCADNFYEAITRDMPNPDPEKWGCTCNSSEIRVVREATEDDYRLPFAFRG